MNCPYCNSPVSVTDRAGNLWYKCGTTKTFRSASCVDREPLATELRNALARIKRLEEAGDAMDKTAEPFVLDTIDEDIPMSDVGEQYEIIYDSPPTAGDHVAMDRARKDWRKAKEAKP